MLKEQVAEELYLQKGHGKLLWHELPDAQKKVWYYKAVPIINLFKAEVDKLTVIDDEALEKDIQKDYPGFTVKGLREEDSEISQWTREAQLQHTEKQLLDLMEGQSSDQ